ncbi:MAG: 50S ribosomal protein L28 [Dehalococcoidales bacterium]|nr:50S ribosomal protein L28 [Dehalococcoidales bacterium]MDD3264607.1 50S ribosomal protein L28 [Dehalococcoidales bacterium]MDD4322092.1 50S ribosomal protein L28 [Dehalococcoidales bacterium]MDD4793663.1 50S ribosomal protein L28 [Dehalococcoidales bacterium]MDD5122411.1 50S ribosomal protein L28 [Dehalococcoidales bacterium]
MKCEFCGKSVQFGHNVSHSKRHTNRTWSANIHPTKVEVDGKITRLKLCTRCRRTQRRVAAKG